jgi:hypothetical protein
MKVKMFLLLVLLSTFGCTDSRTGRAKIIRKTEVNPSTTMIPVGKIIVPLIRGREYELTIRFLNPKDSHQLGYRIVPEKYFNSIKVGDTVFIISPTSTP